MRPARRVQCSGEREPSAHVRTQETAPRGGSCGQGRSRHERPRRHAPRGRAASQRRRLEPLQWRLPLRGRLMVGRLTLDQVVKVRVLAPQPHNSPATAGFVYSRFGGLWSGWTCLFDALAAWTRRGGRVLKPGHLAADGPAAVNQGLAPYTRRFLQRKLALGLLTTSDVHAELLPCPVIRRR